MPSQGLGYGLDFRVMLPSAAHLKVRSGWVFAVAVSALAVLSPALTTPAKAQPVALELVLAVDCSSSVSPEEFRLQMKGIADAFRDRQVVSAIHSAGAGGIAVSLVQWAGARTHVQALDWTLLSDVHSSLALADEIENIPRFYEGGATAIGDAMEYSAALIEANEFEGLRRVIDVSGDGIANQGQSPALARARIAKLGITVNGLAIMNETPKLDRYFMAGVVGGPGGFMLTALDYDDFAVAILQKLIHEISGPPVAVAPGSGVRLAYDLKALESPSALD